MMLRMYLMLAAIPAVLSWDVARTPPMGFNTWNLYHCSVNATILTDTASAMVKFGLKDAGYIYVNSDDCWMSFNRSADGSQVPDPSKFPDGFKAVADFIHSIGMKSGLYTAKGPHTCQKRAASCMHEAQDAASWASWGIDYVKDDSCSTCPNNTDMDDYHRMWQAIQDSGRPMVLTVEGSPPADVITHGGYGNAKRVGHDISPSWSSMISLVDIGSGLWMYAHGSVNATFGGWWNDLDMIEIGNGGPKVGPPPPPPPPGPPGKRMYPWAILPTEAGGGWSITPNGSVTNGGLCLTATGTVEMFECSAALASSQQFTLETNGNLHLQSKEGSCVALEGGQGPALVMALCKTGTGGLNEMFTLKDGALCSSTLGTSPKALCLKSEENIPGGGGTGGSDGFNCIANSAALNRCRVHFTMWTIMKAPLLLGNNIPEMDDVALGVVKNAAALAISQDDLGVQAQRVWSTAGPSTKPHHLNPAAPSTAAVISRCETSRPTQLWRQQNGVLTTTDANGVKWCVRDKEGTEEVGSWRGFPCTRASGTTLKYLADDLEGEAAAMLVTPSGGRLGWNNAEGASGPVPHTRYLYSDHAQSKTSEWIALPAEDHSGTFRLMAADRTTIRSDDKAGHVSAGGDFCLDLTDDTDLEVWAGPLNSSKWAVALLNRDPTSSASITVNYTMFNASSTATFDVQNVWTGESEGSHQGSFTSVVEPQGITYVVLTPA